MTKREVISSIMYDLRLSDSVDFEVDETISANVSKVEGYSSIYRITSCTSPTDKLPEILCGSLSAVRVEIAKMGRTIVQM